MSVILTYEGLPMAIEAANERLACEPFKDKSVKQKVTGHLVVPEQKHSITELKVVFGNEDIPAGASVWVNAAAYIKEWAKAEFTVDDKTFILVPLSEVLLIRKPVSYAPKYDLPFHFSTTLTTDGTGTSVLPPTPNMTGTTDGK